MPAQETNVDWVPIAAVAISALCMVLLVWIAYRQKKIMERQVRLAAFDKRFDAFESFKRYITEVLSAPRNRSHNIHTMSELRTYAQFLFGEEIEELIEVAYQKTGELEERASEYNEAEANTPDQAQAAHRLKEAQDWFTKAKEDAPMKFGKYLNLRDI